jgi:hypothetical protein
LDRASVVVALCCAWLRFARTPSSNDTGSRGLGGTLRKTRIVTQAASDRCTKQTELVHNWQSTSLAVRLVLRQRRSEKTCRTERTVLQPSATG